MKTLIKIGIVALCLVGCDSETPVVSNGRTVYVRDDAPELAAELEARP